MVEKYSNKMIAFSIMCAILIFLFSQSQFEISFFPNPDPIRTRR